MIQKTLISGVFFILLAFNVTFSQQDLIIEINNSNIKVPEVYDFGNVTDVVYAKYIIKNNRNSAVIVSEIVTPAGFFANIADMKIGAGKKVILYIGLKPDFVETKGNFENQIKIKTNLVSDIIINVKGNIVKEE